MKLESMRAYDYHPTFSTVLMDHWRRFNSSAMQNELTSLKIAHPDANVVRIMHSYDAYLRDAKVYLAVFEEMLSLCAANGLRVISCLFNRWHDVNLDCGGIYLEHLIPGLSWAYKENFFAQFMMDVVQAHADDARICLWETCNKPYGAYRDFSKEIIENHLYEERWLREMYCYMRQTEAKAPIAISIQDWFGTEELSEMAKCCDVILRSPYYCNAERTAAIFAKAWPESPMAMYDVLDANN